MESPAETLSLPLVAVVMLTGLGPPAEAARPVNSYHGQ
jgi:hypothetical protein